MRLYLQRRAIRLGSFCHLLVAAVKNVRAPAVKGLSVDGSAPFIRDEALRLLGAADDYIMSALLPISSAFSRFSGGASCFVNLVVLFCDRCREVLGLRRCPAGLESDSGRRRD